MELVQGVYHRKWLGHNGVCCGYVTKRQFIFVFHGQKWNKDRTLVHMLTMEEGKPGKGLYNILYVAETSLNNDKIMNVNHSVIKID